MEASFYEKLADNGVKCTLCSHECVLLPNEMGICKCRVNKDGVLVAKTYGQISGMTSENLGEMGFHFYPNKELKLLSISGYGCNMNCPYCANAHISQGRIHTETLDKEDLVDRLKNLKKSSGVRGVCYTFNEPLIWFEHVRDYSKMLHDEGFMNAMETNGMAHPQAFKELLANMDLVNIDYKGFDKDFYEDYVQGDYQNVLENIQALEESGVYYEVSCVIVAGENDDEAAFEEGMKVLKEKAPSARINLLAVVIRHDEENIQVPTMEKMDALLAIAQRYFTDVKIVEREVLPRW